MAETPIAAPVNKPAETADELIHYAIFSVATKAAVDAIIAGAPGLAAPVFRALLTKLVNWLGGYIYKALARMVTFTIINLQNDAQKSAYVKAEGALRAALLSGDPNAIQASKSDMEAALKKIVHIDGAAPV